MSEFEIKEIEIPLVDVSGNRSTAVLFLQEGTSDDPDAISLRLEAGGRLIAEAVGNNCFQALIGIRQVIEPENLLLHCYGSSINVFPSGMSAGMGIGDKAYRLVPGQKALTGDLVSIFGTGPDVVPSTLAAQKKFYQEWLSSLGNSNP